MAASRKYQLLGNVSTHLIVKIFYLLLLIVFTLIGVLLYRSFSGYSELKIGLVAEISGEIPSVGESSRNGALLAIEQINSQGGLEVGEKKYPVQLLTRDNGANVEKTTQVTSELVGQKVVGIIGPNASRYAIPASDVAEKARVVLISPWSTNPATTLEQAGGKMKSYVFRAAFTDPFQGKVLAQFAYETLKARRAAVLYDETADVLRGQAEFFKNTFESDGGKVTVFGTYAAGDIDFSTQLNAIQQSGVDIIFLPSYYNDAALIIRQAKSFDITTPFLGSDAWGSQDFTTLCGKDCDGFFLTAHYSAESTDPKTQSFVRAYQARYNATPDDVAALTYDSFGLMFDALQKAGNINRITLRSALSDIAEFQGVTGTMRFTKGSGDPTKSVVILQILDGKFHYFSSVLP